MVMWQNFYVMTFPILISILLKKKKKFRGREPLGLYTPFSSPKAKTLSDKYNSGQL